MDMINLVFRDETLDSHGSCYHKGLSQGGLHGARAFRIDRRDMDVTRTIFNQKGRLSPFLLFSIKTTICYLCEISYKSVG